ncbi:MAG: cytochrome c family protein [Nannocystaceae bacterium]|nr:cytochrome c family protein [Nannocystaceae bacterium]
MARWCAGALRWICVSMLAACGLQPTAAPQPGEPARVRMPAPPRTVPTPGRLDDNAGCVRCHPLVAQEWQRSQHRSAYSDPEFARVQARERVDVCQPCHAPEADPSRVADAAAAEHGVACTSCHVPHDGDGRVLAAPHGGAAPHGLRREVAFATAAACAGCHEFDFASQPGQPMQRTISEHRASRFADVSCASCHMPWVGEGDARHRSHDFAASRDPAVLRDAVVVTVARADDSHVRIALAPGAVGHAFPTGDLFRQLLVEAEGFDHDGDPVAYDARVLARHFVSTRGLGSGGGMRLLHDDRVGAHGDAPVIVELDLGEDASALRVRWRVVHQRAEFPLPDGDAVLAGETEVLAGELAPIGGDTVRQR